MMFESSHFGRDTLATINAWEQIKAEVPKAPQIMRGPLPRKSPNLRRFRNPRYRNQWIGNCVGQATSAMAETTARTPEKFTEATVPLTGRNFSPLWSYYQARAYSRSKGIRLGREGAIVTHSLEACRLFGVIDYESWKDTEENERRYTDREVPKGVAEAKRYKPVGSTAILTHPDQILEYNALGYSVCVGSTWRSGATTRADGYFSWGGFAVGGHAYEVMDYDLDANKVWIGNSWEHWGDTVNVGWTELDNWLKSFSERALSNGSSEAVVISEVEGNVFAPRYDSLADILL